MDFKTLAKNAADEVIALRRDLHMHPEASMQEFHTTDRICQELDKLAIPYRRLEPTGVISTIQGGKPGKTVALRADIDALSVEEHTDLPYKSQNPGLMHACGHDTHVAMLLGAAKILNGIKDQLHGTVRLIFQPSEETCEGARAVIAQGGLEGVDMIFGLHIAGTSPKGIVAMCPGAAASAADLFTITINGKSGHGANPQDCVDATVCAGAVISNLQSVVSREFPANKPLVVTVGKLTSGSRFNVISGQAVMEGTVRYYDPDFTGQVGAAITRIAEHTAAAFRCEAEVEYTHVVEPLINHDESYALLWHAAEQVVDDPAMMVTSSPMMGSEDFAEYTALTKGAFAMVGGGTDLPNHSDKIVFDEDSFRTGVALHCQVAWDFLNEEESL